MYHYEKVLKASNIVWLDSSACNLRRHWPECVGHVPVNRTFYFTDAIDILQGAIVPCQLVLNLGLFFFCSKTFLWIIFSVIFKSMNHQLVDKMN